MYNYDILDYLRCILAALFCLVFAASGRVKSLRFWKSVIISMFVFTVLAFGIKIFRLINM